MKKKKLLTCAYCSKKRIPTRDHVIPKALFDPDEPLPENVITVPCCEQCRLKETDTTIFRNTMIALDVTEVHPVARKLQATKMVSSLTRRTQKGVLSTPNQFNPFLTSMVNSIENHEISTPSGIYIGTAPAFNLSKIPEFDMVLKKIVRGLFFHEQGFALQKGWQINWYPSYGKIPDEKDREMAQIFANAPNREIGERIVEYRYVIATDAPKGASMLILLFYGGAEFLVFIIPPGARFDRTKSKIVRPNFVS